MSKLKLLGCTLLLGMLGACGGGGDEEGGGGPGPDVTLPPASTRIGGTAAAGSPIIGTVTVKDSKGASKTENIDLSGTYSIDVAGMTGPFLFKATGVVGGNRVSYVSAATSADVGHSINITPFTDLIVANVAAQIATKYFKNTAPSDSVLTADSLNAATATLSNRIKPMLLALGVDASFDLLRSSFATDHTKFDAVMDVLKVSVDSDTNKATINDLLNHQQIIDDLADKTDSSTLPTPPAGSVADGMTAMNAIRAQFDAFSALFAHGLPNGSSNSFKSLFVASGYKDNGLTDPAALLDGTPVGLTVEQVSVVDTISDTKWKVNTTVTKDGMVIGNLAWFVVKDSSSGKWLFAGNQQDFDFQLQATANRTQASGNSPEFFESVIEVQSDAGAPNIAYLLMTGPGLPRQTIIPGKGPVAGVAVQLANSTSNSVAILDLSMASTSSDWLRECSAATSDLPCYDRSLISGHPTYTATAYDEAGNQVGQPVQATLQALAPTTAVTQANASTLFATITSVSPGTLTDLGKGGNVAVDWTLPATHDSHFVETVGLQVFGVTTSDVRADAVGFDKTHATVQSDSVISAVAANAWVILLGDQNIAYTSGYNIR